MGRCRYNERKRNRKRRKEGGTEGGREIVCVCVCVREVDDGGGMGLVSGIEAPLRPIQFSRGAVFGVKTHSNCEVTCISLFYHTYTTALQAYCQRCDAVYFFLAFFLATSPSTPPNALSLALSFPLLCACPPAILHRCTPPSPRRYGCLAVLLLVLCHTRVVATLGVKVIFAFGYQPTSAHPHREAQTTPL
jgi:hypothetical protein